MRTTIGIRIAAGCVAIIAFMVGMAWLTTSSFNSVPGNFDEMYRQAAKREAAGNLRFSVAQALMAVHKYIVTENELNRNEYNRLNAHVEESKRTLSDISLERDERIIIAEVSRHIDSVRQYAEAILAIPHPRSSQNAHVLMAAMNHIFGDELNKKTTALFDAIGRRSERERLLAAQHKERAAHICLAALFLGALVSAAVTFLVARRMAKPIITVTEAAGERNIMSEKRFRDLIEKSSDAIVMFDATRAILYRSPSVAHIFGYSDEETLGHDFAELIHPDDIPLITDLHNQLLQTPGKEFRAELRYRNKDGNWHCLDTTMTNWLDNPHIGAVVSNIHDITDRKRAEDELRNIKDTYESIFNSVSEAIYVLDENGIFIDVNLGAEIMYGYTRDELIGKSPADVSAPGMNDLAAVQKTTGEVAQTGISQSIEFWGQRKNRETFPKDVYINRGKYFGKDHIIATARDITDRKRVEEQVKASESKLREVIDLVPHFIFAKNSDGKFILANKAVADVYGTTTEDLINKSDYDFNPNEEEVRRFIEDDRKVLESGAELLPYEETITDSKGVKRSLQTTKIPFNFSGMKEPALLGVSVDITDRKRAEDEVRLLQIISRGIGEAENLDEAYALVLREICEATDWEMGEIWIPAADGKKITCHPAWYSRISGLDEFRQASQGQVFLPGEDLPGSVWQTQRSAWYEDLDATANFPRRHAAASSGLKSAFAVPVLAHGRALLVMGFFVTEPRQKDQRLVELISTIASAVGNQIARKQAEQASEQERTFTQGLLDSLPSSVFLLDANGTLLRWNKAGVEISGYPEKEYRRMKVLDFFAAEERKTLQHAIMEAFTKGEARVEAPLLTKSGTLIPMYFAGRRITWKNVPCILGVGIDLSAMKRVEQALEYAEQKYKGIFENAIEGIFQSTPEGKLLDANPSFAQMLGYASPKELLETVKDIGRQLYVAPHKRAEMVFLLEREEIVRNLEYQLRRKDGEAIWVRENARAVYGADGSVDHYEGIVEDITERKALEEKERNLQSQLIQSQKLESIGTLSSGIAHDFNNILAIILGHVDLLRHFNTDATKLAHSMEAITYAALRGTALIKQLLTFAQKSETRFELVLVNDVVHEIVTLLHETFPKTIEIATNLHTDIPVIMGDPTQIHQFLLNLCVNARDAMSGVGTLSVTTGTINRDKMSAQFPKAQAKKYIEIKVSDTGTGMDEATRMRIFEPFFTTKEVGKGTGLGLALVYGIVESHHGFINVKSELGKGTTFRVYLPAYEYKHANAETKIKDPAEVPGGTETILVVEDEEMLRELLKVILVSNGYTVLTAQDGEEGLQTYRRHQKEVAVVVSDIGLPKMSGDELFKNLKQTYPDIKVIFASGFIDPQTRSEMYKAGVKFIIQKPYFASEVLQRIRDVLDDKT